MKRWGFAACAVSACVLYSSPAMPQDCSAQEAAFQSAQAAYLAAKARYDATPKNDDTWMSGTPFLLMNRASDNAQAAWAALSACRSPPVYRPPLGYTNRPGAPAPLTGPVIDVLPGGPSYQRPPGPPPVITTNPWHPRQPGSPQTPTPQTST